MAQRLAHILSRASIRLSQIMVTEHEQSHDPAQKRAGDD